MYNVHVCVYGRKQTAILSVKIMNFHVISHLIGLCKLHSLIWWNFTKMYESAVYYSIHFRRWTSITGNQCDDIKYVLISIFRLIKLHECFKLKTISIYFYFWMRENVVENDRETPPTSKSPISTHLISGALSLLCFYSWTLNWQMEAAAQHGCANNIHTCNPTH